MSDCYISCVRYIYLKSNGIINNDYNLIGYSIFHSDNRIRKFSVHLKNSSQEKIK